MAVNAGMISLPRSCSDRNPAMKTVHSSVPCTAVICFLLCPMLLVSSVQAQGIDFHREVLPILNDHCASCHGGVKKNGGLSVLSRQLMLAKGDSDQPFVVPG